MVRSKIQLLAAGVSILALGVVVPGVAQAQNNDPGLYQDDADGTNDYELDVSDADQYGGYDDSAAAFPAVNVTCSVAGDEALCTEAAEGNVYQLAVLAAGAENNFTNGGNWTVEAADYDDGATPNANAFMDTGFHQEAEAAAGDAENNFTNTGTFNVLVTAVAEADAGFATARAELEEVGYLQEALAAGAAANTITNDGTLNTEVRAEANGEGANAYAEATTGIRQLADGATAENTLTNDGEITKSVVAEAIANGTDAAGEDISGGNADAYALLGNFFNAGVEQNAFGEDSATNDLTNNNLVSLTASAHADAEFDAEADAIVGGGIEQIATAFAAEAVAGNTYTNDGNLVIAADATATAGEDADAFALVDDAVIQVAEANTATNDLANTGTVDITAYAQAEEENGGFGDDARARVAEGIQQIAAGEDGEDSESAVVTLVNGPGADADANPGSINIAATGVAVSEDTSVRATAAIGVGIFGPDTDPDQGILQSAAANADGGEAAALLDNSGSINITARALAGGDFEENDDGELVLDGVSPASAEGYAVVLGGIQQDVTANGEDGVSTATLLNGLGEDGLGDPGEIVIGAFASAAGSDLVFSTAEMGFGIWQQANATGTGGVAEASLTNAGVIDVSVEANALARFGGGDIDGNATANASIHSVTDTEAGLFVGAGIAQFAFSGDGEDGATLNLANTGAIDISATAYAEGENKGDAEANIDDGIEQNVIADDSVASITLTNGGEDGTGSLTIAADAEAVGGDFAYADAWIGHGINQLVGTTGGDTGAADAAVLFTNFGTLDITANANALAGNVGDADATVNTGIYQGVFVGGEASATVANDGDLTVSATAIAAAGNDPGIGADADAEAEVWGIEQAVESFVVEDEAGAVTDGGDFVDPLLTTPGGPASALVANSANLSITADANAAADDFAEAFAGAGSTEFYAIEQNVEGGAGGEDAESASASVTNGEDGVITITAKAVADGSTGATASAYAFGISQNVRSFSVLEESIDPAGPTEAFTVITTTPVGPALASVTNEGVLTVGANANAAGDILEAAAYVGEWDGEDFEAMIAINQEVAGATASAIVDNSGTLDIDAIAVAVGGTDAEAMANVIGIAQEGSAIETVDGPLLDDDVLTEAGDVLLSMLNTGDVTVDASADASATDGDANAFAGAVGYYAFLGSGGALEVANGEDAVFSVLASAAAEGDVGSADAFAIGWDFEAEGGGEGEDAFGGDLAGSVVNDGELLVEAHAIGVLDEEAEDGETVLAAEATGIRMDSATNNLTVTNNGTLDVRASVNDGDDVSAIGILVLGEPELVIIDPDLSAGAGASLVNGSAVLFAAAEDHDNLLTINNSGTIFAGISTDDGETYQWGTAIDLAEAPNAVHINLLEGDVFGNIILEENEIFVGPNGEDEGGETSFNGIINPDQAPDFDAEDYEEDPEVGVFTGELTILDGGTLFLRHTPDAENNPEGEDDSSKAYVGTFTMEDGATLALELPTSWDDEVAEAAYPQIFANEANLAGELEIRPNAGDGPLLYADEYYFDNVIEADVLNGEFDNEGDVVGAGPLLVLDILYPEDGAGQGNVDLAIRRIPFGELGEETPNQEAVGGGLEGAYDPGLEGPFAELLAEIFTLDADEYYDALDQLSGVEYPNFVHALRNNSFTTNIFVADQIDCAIDIRGVDACRNPEDGARFWILGMYNDQELDSNDVYIGYDATNWSALVGVDYRTGNFQIGAFGGYRSLDVNYPDALDSEVEAAGWQLGLTAAYDVGSFYVRGVGSYSTLEGDSQRRIEIGDLSADITGDPDANVWSLYGEAGARFDIGGSWITPFVAIDHTSIKLKSFTEAGGGGANLTVDGQTEDQTSVLVGLKWAGNYGGIVPEVKAAYRHDLDEGRLGVDMSFADGAGSDFRKQEDYDQGSWLVGLSVAGVLSDSITGRIGYLGRFNSEVTDHAVYGSLKFHFGAPAPLPAPAPAPAPLPPVVEPAPAPVVAPGPFIVFFDWDKSDITPQAAAILDNAAAAYQQTGSAQVMLAGNADKSGSADYNVGLSQRRADAVRAYLAGRGIPEGAMSTEAYGESRPLVETADGVREPQNRNVQITFGPGSGQ